MYRTEGGPLWIGRYESGISVEVCQIFNLILPLRDFNFRVAVLRATVLIAIPVFRVCHRFSTMRL